MPRTKEQNHEIRIEKQQLIMKVALRLFANDGYHATSIARIAKEAGISKGLIYTYFESKEDLLHSLIADHSHKMSSILNPNQDNVITLDEAIQSIDKLFEQLKQNAEELKFYYQITIQANILDVLYTPEISAEMEKVMKLQLEFFDSHFEGDAHLWMTEFNSVIKGFSLQYLFAPHLFPSDFVENFKQHIKERFFKQ